jgi:hypothetical protein
MLMIMGAMVTPVSMIMRLIFSMRMTMDMLMHVCVSVAI